MVTMKLKVHCAWTEILTENSTIIMGNPGQGIMGFIELILRVLVLIIHKT